MAFTAGKYELENDDIAGIRLSDADYAKAGTPPSGTQNQSFYVKVGKTTREFGVRPRGVILVRESGTAPDTFKKYKFLPVLTKAAFAGSGFSIGATITIGTTDWKVAKKVNEKY